MVEGLRRFLFPVYLVAAGSRPQFLVCGIWAYTPGVGGFFEMKPGSWTPVQAWLEQLQMLLDFFFSFLLLHICILAFANLPHREVFLDLFTESKPLSSTINPTL